MIDEHLTRKSPSIKIRSYKLIMLPPPFNGQRENHNSGWECSMTGERDWRPGNMLCPPGLARIYAAALLHVKGLPSILHSADIPAGWQDIERTGFTDLLQPSEWAHLFVNFVVGIYYLLALFAFLWLFVVTPASIINSEGQSSSAIISN